MNPPLNKMQNKTIRHSGHFPFSPNQEFYVDKIHVLFVQAPLADFVYIIGKIMITITFIEMYFFLSSFTYSIYICEYLLDKGL